MISNFIYKYILSLRMFGSVMIFALPLAASAQSISTDNPTVDLGQIMYENPSTAIYTIKNATASPVQITNIDTGCGCVDAKMSSDVIGAGSEAKLRVTYDAHQLGVFERSILVTDNTSDQPYELRLKGRVVLKVDNFSGVYPNTLGNLLSDVTSIEFDDVNKGERISQEIHIMNPSGQYVEPVVMHLPSYLRAEVIPTRLAPKTGGIVRFVLDSRNLRSYGLNQTGVYLAANKGEKISDDKEITVSAVLLPEAVAIDDMRRINGPRISLSENVIDMTDFVGKAKKKSEVVITNNGKSTLEITSMQMFTPGLEVTLPKRKIAPGQSVKMKVTGNASQLHKVRTRPRILMITNDPDNQKVVVEIKK